MAADADVDVDVDLLRTALWTVVDGHARLTGIGLAIVLGLGGGLWAIGSVYWVMPVFLGGGLLAGTFAIVGVIALVFEVALWRAPAASVQRVWARDWPVTIDGVLAVGLAVMVAGVGATILATPQTATVTVTVGDATLTHALRPVLLVALAGVVVGVLGMLYTMAE